MLFFPLVKSILSLSFQSVTFSRAGETPNGGGKGLGRRRGEEQHCHLFRRYVQSNVYFLLSCVFYQEVKYPGEPLKTLIALLFQVKLNMRGKTRGNINCQKHCIHLYQTTWHSFQCGHFQLAGMVTTTIALIITNEFVPDSPTDNPLPDKVAKLN